MEKTYQAKTLDDALEQACNDLGLEKGEFSYEVEEYGSKGFLGIGAKDTVIRVSYTPDPCVCARTYLEGLFGYLGIEDSAIDITLGDENTVAVQVTGKDASILTKNRGEGVDALQLLLSLIVNRDCGEYFKISFNVNDYKEKSKERLEALALKTAAQVVRNRRKTTLPPMTSFQRRIIHSKLHDYENITTYSVGEDPSRRVVVSYCGPDGPAPRAPREGGNRYGKQGGKFGSNRGPRPQRSPRPEESGENAETVEESAPRESRERYDRPRNYDRSSRPMRGERRSYGDRKPRREYVPEGEVYTGEITHLPGEKLSGTAAKKAESTESVAPTAGASASPVTGGTPFDMGGNE